MRSLRLYHPGHRLSWAERLYDGFAGRRVRERPEGVDWSLVDRAAARRLRLLVDAGPRVIHLGDDMVRVDAALELPDDEAARADLAGEIVRRLRVVQTEGLLRHPLGVRWVQFDPGPEGTRLLVRLRDRLDPGRHTWLELNTAEGQPSDWAGLAVG